MAVRQLFSDKKYTAFIMQRAVISIVLIAGQLAMLCAAPLYVCTSAEGVGRIEWGACECRDSSANSGHQHANCNGGEPFSQATDREIASPPCHCDHQPLADASRLAGRLQGDSWGAFTATLAEIATWPPVKASAGPMLLAVAAPRGHTPLVDRLSICLRC